LMLNSPLQTVSDHKPQFGYSLTVTTMEECQEAQEDHLQLPWAIRGNVSVVSVSCSDHFPGIGSI